MQARPMKHINKNTGFKLVHIGKCAGSSLRTELIKNKFNFQAFHMAKPSFHSSFFYVITTRDPANRISSAFYWRKFLLSTSLREGEAHPLKTMRLKHEKEFLDHYASINHLASDLADHKNRLQLDHLMPSLGHHFHGFTWYLKELLTKANPKQIICEIRQEHFTEDCKRHFGFQAGSKANQAYPKGEPLTQKNREILSEYLRDEYLTLKKLRELLSS